MPAQAFFLMVLPSIIVPICVCILLLCCSPERVHRGRLEMCVGSMWNHAPKALAAGDEVCISYDHMPLLPIPQMAGMHRGAAFLVCGFVPSEYLPARRCEPK